MSELISRQLHNVSSSIPKNGAVFFIAFLAISNAHINSALPSVEIYQNVYSNFTASTDCINFDTHNVVIGDCSDINLGYNLNDDLIYNIKKLSAIQELKSNWNGNGAPAFSTNLINKVKQLLYDLRIQPEVFPTAANSIQLEYDGDNGSYLEFQIYDTDKIEAFCLDKNGDEKEWIISDASELNEVVLQFYG